MRRYDLWLDESGSFEQWEQASMTRYPSLIGGILIEQGKLTDDEITRLVGQDKLHARSHGNKMTRNERRDVMIPALESITAHGGHLVFFENIEHLDFYQERELYLRMMASGLLQLFEKIGASGEFVIDIMLAMRTATDEQTRSLIEDAEYMRYLRSYMYEGWQNGSFDLENECRINITIADARIERRLQLADYACNTRLTRNSHLYNDTDRAVINSFYEDEYIFSIKVHSAENRIITSLVTKDIPSALYVFYTSRETMNRRKMKKLIFDNISKEAFYPLRLMINEFTDRILYMVSRESELEHGEAILKRIVNSFYPEIQKSAPELQTDEAFFRTLLCLAEIYLREGDIANASDIIQKMKIVVQDMNYHMESVKWLYFYNDRKALLQIEQMDYKAAIITMQKSINTLQRISGMITSSDELNDFFDGKAPLSEYLGNAYTMMIYAKMFLQKLNPDFDVDRLREESDFALKQYHFEGEQERNRQYRAHIEMAAGEVRTAVYWLLLSKNIFTDVSDTRRLYSDLIEYLNVSDGESRLSQDYDLMYYIELMLAALREKEEAVSDTMHKALIDQKEVFDEIFEFEDSQSEIIFDAKKKPVVYEDFLFNRIKVERRQYHPREIILWKYGRYCAMTQLNIRTAFDLWDKAIKICNNDNDYVRMKVIAVAIAAEKAAFAMKRDVKVSEQIQCLNRLIKLTSKAFARRDLPEKMKDYLCEIKSYLTDYTEKITEGKEEFAEGLLVLTERIAY